MRTRSKNARRKLAESMGSSLTADRVLRKRSKKKSKPAYTDSIILDYRGGDILKPLLRGPILDPFRHGDNIHVSDLIYKCARKMVLARRFDQPMLGKEIYDSQGLTFAMGNAMHDYIRGKVAGRHGDKMFGTWSCLCGEKTHRGIRSDAALVGDCARCGKGLQTYGEFQIVNQKLGVTGSIDLTLLEQDAFILTEIKSINKKAWEELVRPLPEHLIQILIYWYLVREQGYSVHDRVSVLYAIKDWVFKNPYKEYILQPSKLMHRITEYIDDATALREALNDKRAPLPIRVSCPTREAPAARKCELANICFNVE